MGHSVRSCILGMRIAQEIGLPEADQGDLYYTLLLKDAGCGSNSSRLHHILNADDLRAKGDLKTVDWTRVGWESLHYAVTHVATSTPYPQRICHSRFSFVVGAMPELLSTADWKYVDAPGTAGATYGLQQQKSAINALRMAAGVGVSFGSKFSWGATVGADYNTNTLQAPYIFQTQPQLAGLKTLLDLHTSGVGWNASLGALAHPTRKLEVGLAWKSRTVINSSGTAIGDAYAQFAALGVSAPANFIYSARV